MTILHESTGAMMVIGGGGGACALGFSFGQGGGAKWTK